MKNLKLTKLVLIVALMLVASCQVSNAWDCVEAHPAINELAGKHFAIKAYKGYFGDKYKLSPIDTTLKFSGYTFKKAKMTERGSKKYLTQTTFIGWLARGGHDADVPSLAMGFRHFYDPIYEPHYLTWMRRWLKKPKKSRFASEAEYFKSLDYIADDWNPNFELGDKKRKLKLQPKLIKPQIDAITWALEHEENDHCFKQGLIAYKVAMENDKEKLGKLSRSQMFGKAFRCLGETMHLVADMAQPAHVRADSHSVHEPVEKTVKGKMIRKIIGEHWKDVDFKPTSDFEFKKNVTPKQLMINLAKFTNKRFFSNDTIFDYEKWIFPRNHKKPYPSPQLSKLKHIKGIYYSYFEDIGWIPLVKETGSLFSMVLRKSDKYGRKRPKFNVVPEMAEAQAKVLIPLAVFNAAEMIDHFMPTMSMKLKVNHKDGNTYSLEGSLIHQIENDPEWQPIGEIKYSGVGFINVNGKSRMKCFFKNGVLTDCEANFDSGDVIRICVRNGGRIFWSEPHKI